MPPSDKQLNDVHAAIREATSQLVETTTTLRSHIVEQRGINARWDRMATDHDQRIRGLEDRQARLETRVPKKLVDGEEIVEDLARIENKVDRVSAKVLMWSGGIAASVTILTLLIAWLAI
jgi:phage shock protein A